MERSWCDIRLPRYMGHLYAISIRWMLHFSFVLGFLMFLRRIFYCGLATCFRHASWMQKDAVSSGWKGRCGMTSLWSISSSVVGPMLVFCTVYCFVEQAMDLVTFVSTGDESLKENFCMCDFILV